MGVTQIVSLKGASEKLEKSLRVFPTKKIVFLTQKEDLAHVLPIRNEMALRYSIPTEVRVVNTSAAEIYDVIAMYKDEDPLVHLLDNEFLNSFILSAAYLAGVTTYRSNGNGVEKLTD